ncbi:MAG: addiction module protein [Bacteroidales bacterium]|nr:addiction module protein [Bacteroidales bacterium]MCF8455148.1 addiction module protein [Bacteroidales bacterium]
MGVTIKISDTNSYLAKNLLWYLKSLTEAKEYGFLEIIEESDLELTDAQVEELDKRYDHFLKNKDDYPDWEQVKQKYLG